MARQRPTSETVNETDPVFKYTDNLWYFWDETWCNAYGPYKNVEKATDALTKYAKLLDVGKEDDFGPAARI